MSNPKPVPDPFPFLYLRFTGAVTKVLVRLFLLKLLKIIFLKVKTSEMCPLWQAIPIIVSEALESGGIEGIQCSGFNCIPQKDILKCKPPELVNKILFANEVFVDVIN